VSGLASGASSPTSTRIDSFLRKLLVWGLTVGLIGNAIYATLIMSIPRYDASIELLVIATVAQGIGAPLLMLGYVAAICLLALRPRRGGGGWRCWRRWGRWR
jgi:uncharacterized membrane protein YeiB